MGGGGHQESLDSLSQTCENIIECCSCSQQEEQEPTSELEPGVTCKILLWPPREGLAAPRVNSAPGSLQTPRGMDNHPLFLREEQSETQEVKCFDNDSQPLPAFCSQKGLLEGCQAFPRDRQEPVRAMQGMCSELAASRSLWHASRQIAR